MNIYIYTHTHIYTHMDFPRNSVGKESACNIGDPGSIPGLGRSPEEGNGNPLQYSCLEDPTNRGAWQALTSIRLQELDMTWRLNHHHHIYIRCILGCSPWGRWGSDTTERLHFHFSLSCIGEGNGHPLQCSCLENPGDEGAWWAAIYGVTQSRTRLKPLSSSSSSSSIL